MQRHLMRRSTTATLSDALGRLGIDVRQRRCPALYQSRKSTADAGEPVVHPRQARGLCHMSFINNIPRDAMTGRLGTGVGMVGQQHGCWCGAIGAPKSRPNRYNQVVPSGETRRSVLLRENQIAHLGDGQVVADDLVDRAAADFGHDPGDQVAIPDELF